MTWTAMKEWNKSHKQHDFTSWIYVELMIRKIVLYTAKLLTAVRRGSVDVPTQYRHASDPHRRSKKHELRLTQYR